MERYNKLLFGPNDVVNNICPTKTSLWNGQCCCGTGCCWDQCDWQTPPTDCIQDVPASEWVKTLGYYQAYKYEGMGLFQLISGSI